jgi:O-succinylbenzoic acid--CoA ligase
MKHRERPYLIQGKAFSQDELELFCTQKVADQKPAEWEKECYYFILEWFSPLSSIKVHTSGSTGRPKEIYLQKEFMEVSARATIEFFKLKPENNALLCLPVKYIAGKMMIVRALVGGLNLLINEPTSVPDIEKFQKIDFCAMVPNQVASLFETEKGIEQLERIQNLIIGGSFIPQNLESKIKQLANQVWQTYGMTETITHIALRKISGKKKTTWFTPLIYVNVKLDRRSCLVISAEEIGVKKLVTNDLAKMTVKNKFKILGRIDNVILSGGVKLFPEKIEKKLSGWIQNSFYFGGLPDDKLGQRMVLYIEDEGKLRTEIYQIWEKIEAKLKGFEIPKEIIFREHFNRTENGKIIRE